jgi:hypothetical protein
VPPFPEVGLLTGQFFVRPERKEAASQAHQQASDTQDIRRSKDDCPTGVTQMIQEEGSSRPYFTEIPKR